MAGAMDIVAVRLKVRVPAALTTNEAQAVSRALVFAQLSNGMGYPQVERVAPDGKGGHFVTVKTSIEGDR